MHETVQVQMVASGTLGYGSLQVLFNRYGVPDTYKLEQSEVSSFFLCKNRNQIYKLPYAWDSLYTGS